MSAIQNGMRIGVITLGALLGLAGATGVAAAQTARPPVPAPVPMPAPVVKPVPVPAPAVLLDPIALDQWRLSMDDFKLSLPDFNMTIANAKVAQDAARDALENMKFVYDFDPRFGPHFVDQQMVYASGDYNAGKDYINRGQYDQAIVRFERVIAKKADNVDGSLYYKAYAQYKLGKTDEALTTIAALRKDYAQSAYMPDAKALETLARQRAGKPVNPADVDDDELKVLAINGIKNTDPERAIPQLESVLKSANTPRVKRQAIYVLASIENPRAYQVLLGYAKGAGNPDLQLDAIRYLTASRKNQQTSAKDLQEIYQGTQDNNVKMAIIGAWRSSGNSPALTQVVSSGQQPMMIRQSALSGLANILGPQDLYTLYEKETNKDLKLQMVSVFGSMQAFDQLNRVIKTEKDPEVRRRALRALGMMKTEKTGQILVDLYGSETDVDAKRSIISSLGGQNNAEGLVAIARKETSVQLKTEIVRKLADMAPRSKVAADYLMEIIR